jgi:tetratricopeptide (TPR) repeat protein
LGPVRATRSYGLWKIAFSGKVFTGSVSAVPRDTTRWRERALAVVAGGPSMTLVTGLIAGLVLSRCPCGAWTKMFLASIVEFSCFLFVLGLIPNARSAKIRNDARLFWTFWEDGVDAHEVFLYHLITMQEISGLRPRDYSAGLIHAMACTNGRREVMLVFAHKIAEWALDRGDFETAKAWDERALELSAGTTETAQDATLARSACLDVLLRDDFAAARTKLAGVDLEALAPDWLRHRTNAVHLFAKGEKPEALAEISRARHSFPKHLPYFEFEQILLSILHRKALGVEPKDLATSRTSPAA